MKDSGKELEPKPPGLKKAASKVKAEALRRYKQRHRSSMDRHEKALEKQFNENKQDNCQSPLLKTPDILEEDVFLPEPAVNSSTPITINVHIPGEHSGHPQKSSSSPPSLGGVLESQTSNMKENIPSSHLLQTDKENKNGIAEKGKTKENESKYEIDEKQASCSSDNDQLIENVEHRVASPGENDVISESASQESNDNTIVTGQPERQPTEGLFIEGELF